MAPVSSGWRPVIWLGCVALLTAIAGEAARSISGPLLKQLGASAVAVSVVAGAGELLGYTLRLGAGFLADRRGGAWRLLLAGSVLGISAVPLLAVAAEWRLAAGLYLMERIGRAVRTPARDVLLASASDQIGHGPGFGLHRLLDQTGAVIGPLIIAALFTPASGYRNALLVVFVPSAIGIAVLLRARHIYPDLGKPLTETPSKGSLGARFWMLCAAAGLLAAGTADFALISFHLAKQANEGLSGIALLYAMAMAVEGVAAMVLGFVLERVGALALLFTIAMSSVGGVLLFAVPVLPVVGVAVWSAGMGGQYALLRALVPGRVPAGARGAAFGWFNTVFGVCWFAGSVAMGLLYSVDARWVAWFAVAAQLAAAPVVLWGWRAGRVRS